MATAPVLLLATVDRDLGTQVWLRDQAIDRLAMDAAVLAHRRIDQLLDQRLTITGRCDARTP